MTCYHPIDAFRSLKKKGNGKHHILFKFPKNYNQYERLNLPCGQCHGCRLDRSRQWAIRCSHEASLYNNNCFITLTYNNANLPPDGSLNLKHFQLFMKRLRSYIKPNTVRFFHCGEYGEQNNRPHYHACLFNYDFSDKILHKIENGNKIYQSPLLERLWGKGFCTVGAVTFQSSAYVARYIMKKINGDAAEAHYKRQFLDTDTGEIIDYQLQPEYTTMSRRPGIGTEWFKKFNADVYPGDFVVINGKKMRTPKFYDNLFEILDQDEYDLVKQKRLEKAEQHLQDQTPQRLQDRETVQKARSSRLIRTI